MNMRLFYHLREVLGDFVRECKAYFYDSYTGFKLRRIAVAVGSFTALLLLLVVTASYIPNSGLPDALEQGVGNALDVILPDKLAETVKNVIGIDNRDILKYPEMGDATQPADTGVLPYGREVMGDDWLWTGSRGPQKFGDIKSHEGAKPEKSTEAVQGNTSKSELGRYNSWQSKVELQNVVLLATETIRDSVLLQINNATESGMWNTYLIGARSVLVDVQALGVQIKPNMSKETVASWNTLEPVYVQLYADLYACENAGDLMKVAQSATYKKALSMTAEFLAVLDAERASNNE